MARLGQHGTIVTFDEATVNGVQVGQRLGVSAGQLLPASERSAAVETLNDVDALFPEESRSGQIARRGRIEPVRETLAARFEAAVVGSYAFAVHFHERFLEGIVLTIIRRTAAAALTRFGIGRTFSFEFLA